MDLSIRQLRVIVAIAEEHSFTAAGRRLRLSQQSVSALLRDAEARLGTRLFERSTRRVEPTPAGLALVAELAVSLSRIDAALRAAGQGGRAERRLVIAVTPAVAYGELNMILEHYSDGGHEVPDIREAWQAELVEGIVAGRFDAGLGVELPRLPAIRSWTWRRQRADLLVADGHRFAGRESVRVAELDDVAFAMPGEQTNPGLATRLVAAFESAGVHPRLVEIARVAGPAPVAVERGEAVTIWLTGMQDRYLPKGLQRVRLVAPETVLTTRYAIAAQGEPECPLQLQTLYAALWETSNLREPEPVTS